VRSMSERFESVRAYTKIALSKYSSFPFLYRPLLPIRAKFDALEQTRGIRLRAKFRLDRCKLILSPSGGENPQILPFFGLRHFVVSPLGSNVKKLNKDAQLRPLPYPTASKCTFYVLKRLHGEIVLTISDVH